MHTAVALLDIEAGVNFIHSALIILERKSSAKKESLLRLRTATKQPPQIKGLIVLRLRLRDPRTRVWFGVAPKLAVNILLGTAFIGRFIRGIFPP